MTGKAETGEVVAVCRSGHHTFAKQAQTLIRLRAGQGVEGDAHAGVTVKHRSRVARDPQAPNLRQVHLIHAELFDELQAAGYAIGPGDLGENIATLGVDLLGLPQGARLKLGREAEVEITGLRNPCGQIENAHSGLLQRVIGRDDAGNIVRKAGVMAVVCAGGEVAPSDRVSVILPDLPHRPLRVV